ncbi:MAG: GIY-YIG nuclease family protein [Cyanobacteriota bacterium]
MPYYKIGKAKDLNQRVKQIKLHPPYSLDTLHSIETDDSIGIESCWHICFARKRANGEWFLMTDDDVATFVSRKTM